MRGVIQIREGCAMGLQSERQSSGAGEVGATRTRVLDTARLLEELGDAVQTRAEGQVFAEFVTARAGGACVVLARESGNWFVIGKRGVSLDIDLPPSNVLPEEWLSTLTPGLSWRRRDLYHGRRLVGKVLLQADILPAAELATLCAMFAPFLAAARPRVSQSAQAVELYFAEIIHDLRQPLSTLSLTMDMLEQSTTLGDTTHLQRCRRAVRQMRELVDDLGASPRRSLAPVALAPLLAELVDDNIDYARTRSVDLKLQILARPSVTGPRLALVRAIGNLVNNAIDNTPEGSTVRVVLDADGDRAVVEVHDAGAGVPAELRERVFEPFFTTRAAGTGLGLAVTRMVAQAHGGTVGFVDGLGGVVRMRLPQLCAATFTAGCAQAG
jgi:signal transduction histidine kinase